MTEVPSFASDDERRRAAAERMRRRDGAVDEAIRRAESDGAFDNLPGKGKPLVWRDDIHAGDMALAYHMMANAGFAPGWIENGKELRRLVDELESGLSGWDAWRSGQERELASLPPGEAEERRAEIKDQARARRERFGREATELNERIRRHNLGVPFASARLPLIDVEGARQAFGRDL